MNNRLKISYILCLSLIVSIGISQCIEDVEVELWSECYNIETTIAVDLYNDNLYGEIPDEIGQLTNLVELNLGRNNFTGVIPN